MRKGPDEVVILEISGITHLYYDEHFWMTDTSIDEAEQKALSDQAYGTVLVAGYGLGILQRHLSENPRVTSFITVEINKNVITEVAKKYGVIYGHWIVGDFFGLPESKKFDCIIGDIWADATPEYRYMYLRFLEKANRMIVPDGSVIAWKADLF